MEVDVVEDWDFFDVVEGDMIEIDTALDVVELECVFLVLDTGFGVQYLEDALPARHRPLEHRVLEHKVPDRVEEAGHVDRECGECAESGGGVQAAGVKGNDTADDEDGGRRNRDGQFNERDDRRRKCASPDVRVPVLLVELVKAAGVDVLTREGLDRADFRSHSLRASRRAG